MPSRSARPGLLLALLLLGLTAAPAGAVESVRADRGSVAVGGDVGGSITIGLTPKEVRELVDRILSEAGVDAAQLVELATELGVTRGAVETFLRTLGEYHLRSSLTARRASPAAGCKRVASASAGPR